MTYRYKFVIRQPDHSHDVYTIDPERGADIIAAAELRGWSYVKPCQRAGLREELIGHPVFRELTGPMYDGRRDGVDIIRYEGRA